MYWVSNQVKEKEVELVEHNLPLMLAIKQLKADINEQERIVYEYYATQQADIFWQYFKQNRAQIGLHQQVLSQQSGLDDELLRLQRQQQNIQHLIDQFHQEMLQPTIDWDLLRSLLAQMSAVRRDLLHYLNQMSEVTESAVEQSHQQTLASMEQAHALIIFYALLLVFLALVVAKYLRQYVINQGKVARLALFPKHNPNPILSLDQSGQVVFYNPACSQFLQRCQLSTVDFSVLIPEQFNELAETIISSSSHSQIIEHRIADRVVQITINWLAELQVFDLHLIDITEKIKAEQQVKKLAYYNGDTLLPNQNKLAEQVAYQAKRQKPCLLLLL